MRIKRAHTHTIPYNTITISVGAGTNKKHTQLTIIIIRVFVRSGSTNIVFGLRFNSGAGRTARFVRLLASSALNLSAHKIAKTTTTATRLADIWLPCGGACQYRASQCTHNNTKLHNYSTMPIECRNVFLQPVLRYLEWDSINSVCSGHIVAVQ